MLSPPAVHTARFLVYEIPISQPSASIWFFYDFHSTSAPQRLQIGELAMSDRRMIDTNGGSKGDRRPVLFFAVVAASLTVMLVIGVSGSHVAPNAQQQETT